MKLKKYDTEMFNLKEKSGLPSYFYLILIDRSKAQFSVDNICTTTTMALSD
jgi:hypothetical protein